MSAALALGGQHDIGQALHCFQARSVERDTFSCSSDSSGHFASKGWKSRDAISVFSSRQGLFRKQAVKQHTRTCQFGKRGFSALYLRQGGTISSFLVLATFVKINSPLHTMCFPLGLGLCPKGSTSSKYSWCSRGSRVVHLRCHVALFSFPCSHSTTCQAAPAPLRATEFMWMLLHPQLCYLPWH